MRRLLLAILFCGAALPATAQDVAGAKAASLRFTAALGSGDAATAASFFADDGVVLAPGRGEVSGKAQIQRYFGNMGRFVKSQKYTPDDVKALNDTTAREVGTFNFQMAKQDVSGKYLLIWTKVGNDWKVAADMWNRTGGGRQGGGKARQGGTGGTGGTEGAPGAEDPSGNPAQ